MVFHGLKSVSFRLFSWSEATAGCEDLLVLLASRLRLWSSEQIPKWDERSTQIGKLEPVKAWNLLISQQSLAALQALRCKGRSLYCHVAIAITGSLWLATFLSDSHSDSDQSESSLIGRFLFDGRPGGVFYVLIAPDGFSIAMLMVEYVESLWSFQLNGRWELQDGRHAVLGGEQLWLINLWSPWPVAVDCFLGSSLHQQNWRNSEGTPKELRIARCTVLHCASSTPGQASSARSLDAVTAWPRSSVFPQGLRSRKVPVRWP